MSRKNSKFNNNTKLYIKQFNKLLENQKEKQQWTQNHLVELINKNINPQSRLSSKAIHIVLKKQNKYDVFQYNNNFVSYIFVKIESEKQKKIK